MVDVDVLKHKYDTDNNCYVKWWQGDGHSCADSLYSHVANDSSLADELGGSRGDVLDGSETLVVNSSTVQSHSVNSLLSHYVDNWGSVAGGS